MIHLHGHSTFSFLEAIWWPDNAIDRAKELSMSSIAITDYNGMYGAIKFYQKAKAAQINPIIWLETGFVLDVKSHFKKEQVWNICLLAKNKTGYHNLLKITSYANMEGLAETPKIDIEILEKCSDWLVVFMWWTKSRIWKMIYNKQSSQKITEIINMLIKIFGKDNVFGEIIAQSYTEIPELEDINNQVISLSEKTQISCIVSTNYHYIKKTDKAAREMALAIKDGLKMYDEHRRKPKGEYYIATEKDVLDCMTKNWHTDKQTKNRIQTNVQIAESINIEIDLYQALFPNYEAPDHIVTIYEENKNNLITI